MTPENGKKTVLTIFALCIGLIVDIYSHLGLSIGFVFCLIILSAMQNGQIKFVHLISSLSVLFIIVGFLLRNEELQLDVNADFLNRILAIVTISATWFYSVKQIKTHFKNQKQSESLDNLINAAELGTINFTNSDVTLSHQAQKLFETDSKSWSLDVFFEMFSSTETESLKNLVQNNDGSSISMRTRQANLKYEWFQLIKLSNIEGTTSFAVQPITQRSQIDLILDKERLKFEQLANSLPIFVTTFTQEGKIDFISDNHESFFGESLNDLREGWQNFIHRDDAPHIHQQWQTALQEQKQSTLKYRVINNKSQTRYFISHLKPITNKKSGRVTWFCASFDNTETEMLRLENDKFVAKLQGILQGMEDGFISLERRDNKFVIEFHNFRAEILISLEPDSEGLEVSQASEFFQNKLLISECEKVESDQNTRTLSIKYNQADLFVRIHASLNGVRLYIQDITSEKASIDELNLLRKAIDKANDVVLITKADTIDSPGPEVVYVNDAFETVTGYNKSDIIGKSPRLLQGPNTEREKLDEIRSALEKNQPIRVLVTNYTKVGEPYSNELDINPITDDNGNVTHFIAVERDISKQKVQEELAFRAHKMDSIGLVTGGVAHDFNNLLTIIMGNADILLDASQTFSDEQRKEKLQAITEAATQGVSLTRSLLAFSKRQPFADNTVDLESVVNSIHPILSTALGAEIKFDVSNKSNVKYVNGDQSQVESLFLNMAINARDAMKEGGKFDVVILDTTINKDDPLTATLQPGNYVKIIFRDNGSGIEKENLDKIFDPFFSTKPLTKGTGLGLSMIYSFISQSGGHIEVSSKVGIGTEFKVYLQVSDKEQSRQTGEIERAISGDVPANNYLNQTVLIVEDTEMVAKVAIHILSTMGFEVHKAEDAQQAIELFEKHKIDLLFTDIILPNGMNGKELSQKLRERQPDLPIIYTSGFTDGKLKHEDYQQENVEFLQKPYTKKDLVKIINELHI